MSIRMFVKKDTIPIPVWVYEVDGNVEATHDKDDVPDSAETSQVNFIFRKANFADSNKILRQVQSSDPDAPIDVAGFQELVLRELLFDWDLKDDNGGKVAINRSTIDSLEPTVARAAAAGIMTKIRI